MFLMVERLRTETGLALSQDGSCHASVRPSGRCKNSAGVGSCHASVHGKALYEQRRKFRLPAKKALNENCISCSFLLHSSCDHFSAQVTRSAVSQAMCSLLSSSDR